jgi:hypothetical protein
MGQIRTARTITFDGARSAFGMSDIAKRPLKLFQFVFHGLSGRVPVHRLCRTGRCPVQRSSQIQRPYPFDGNGHEGRPGRFHIPSPGFYPGLKALWDS